MSKPLSGKIAWITGAGSGIGEATAMALADDGALTVLSGRRRAPLDAAAKKIAAGGGRADVEPLDVGDSKSVDAAAGEILNRHGRVDILVNSAGLNVPDRYWGAVDVAGWDKVVGADLNGAFYTIRSVIAGMRARKDGLAVNIASWAGRYDLYLTGPAYNAAKRGLAAMTAHLNMAEGKNGIRATVICPAEVNTPILATRPVPVPDELRAKMLQPQDLAETIRFVARLPARVSIAEIVMGPADNRLWMNPVS